MNIKPFYIFKIKLHFSKTHVQNSIKRFGRLLYKAFQKNNMIVATRNTCFKKHSTFVVLIFFTIINNFSECLCYPFFIKNY